MTSAKEYVIETSKGQSYTHFATSFQALLSHLRREENPKKLLRIFERKTYLELIWKEQE